MNATLLWVNRPAFARPKQRTYRELMLVPTRESAGEHAEASYGSEVGVSSGQSITVQLTDLADAGAIANHCAYLGRMATEGVVPSELSARARSVWELARKTVPKLPVPAAVAYDGGPIHYTWDDGRHQVTAEVLADGLCEWYVSDRQTGVFDGGDFDPADGLPETMISGLRQISA